jgi:hypothetical protein
VLGVAPTRASSCDGDAPRGAVCAWIEGEPKRWVGKKCDACRKPRGVRNVRIGKNAGTLSPTLSDNPLAPVQRRFP